MSNTISTIKVELPTTFRNTFWLENDNGNTGWKRGGALESMDAAGKLVMEAEVHSTKQYVTLELNRAEAEFLAEELEEAAHPYGIIAERLEDSDQIVWRNYMRTAAKYAKKIRSALT